MSQQNKDRVTKTLEMLAEALGVILVILPFFIKRRK